MDFLSSIFGSKPEIADYQPVNLQEDQLKAIEGDIAAWPDIAQLGNLFQQYMLNQYEAAIPGFRDILKMGGQTTKDMLGQSDQLLRGQIPQDVQEAVQRSSAFQNLLSGGGGGMAQANTARNFGLTSLDLINQGASLAGQAGNAAQRWAALSGAQLPEGMLVTPQQQAALDMQQNLIKRNIQQQKFNVAAAPDPTMKGISDIVANLTAAYLGSQGGGAMRGGGGGGGGGGAPATYGAAQMGVGDTTYGASAQPGLGYSKDTPAFTPVTFTDTGTTDYFGGYGGVAPGYSGIQSNPFSDTPTNLWDQYSYNSNFPTGG